jgi:signal transduction histidine kinase
MSLRWLENLKSSNKVAAKVFLLLIIYSSLITFTFSLFQIYHAHNSQKDLIESQLNNIDKSFLEGFSEAAWSLNPTQIRNLSLSLFNRDYVHHLKVDLTGIDPIKFGEKSKGKSLKNSIKIDFTINGHTKHLGYIFLESDLKYLNLETKKNFISIFFYNGIKVLSIAAVLILLMTHFVGIPLHNLSHFSRNIFEKGDYSSFEFKDEFAEVADTIKLMYFDLDKNYQEIKKSEERFRDMSQFKKRIVWETDLNMNVTYVSDTLRNNCLTKNILSLEPWSNCKESLLHKFLFLKSLQSFRDLEISFNFLGSPNFWSVSAKPFFDDRGRHIGYRFVSEDITQSKILHDKLESQKEQMRQSQKLESLGQITGGLTHDFNNLLMIIQGSLRNITKSMERGKDFTKYVKTANNAVDRGRKLTKKLLVYSRKEVLAPTEQNINYLVDDMTDILEKCLNEKISFETSLCTEETNVLIDPIELENACINMAINSRDAMPSGGRISLSTSKVHISEKEDQLEKGDYVLLSFKDNGKGIPSHIIDKVFEPFFTTKEVGQGTGLGLSQLYGFMKDSNGKVEVNSVLNEGTKIDMYFPVLSPSVEQNIQLI